MTRTHVIVLTAVLLLAAGAPLGSTGATAQADCGFPFSSTDATGTSVTIEEEPERIVTLNPSAAQTMWEIGAEEKVVGLSTFASYLDGAESREVVWEFSGANVEKIVALEPDLVLAPNTVRDDTVGQLRNAGLTVYKFEAAGSIEDVYEKTELTGRLVGECEAAADRVDRMREDVETIREATEDVDRPLALYVLAQDGWTAGEGTFVDTVITTAGARNLASESGISGYRQISDEVVLSENPEWIVLNTDVPEVPSSSAYQQTEAVTEGNVVVVNANYVSQPAPRIVEAMETLVRAFHPDAYEAALEGDESGDGGGIEVSAPGDNPIPTAAESPTPEPTTTGAGATTTAQADSTEATGGASNASADSAASTATATATVTTTEPTPTPTAATTTEAGAGDEATTETPTPTATATDVETVQEPGGLPGFGIGVTLVALALVAAGAMARRRP